MDSSQEKALAQRDIRLPFLDHLRGVAILTVFFYHAVAAASGADHLTWQGLWPDPQISHAFLPVAYGGNLGVGIFFVVSGFCVHLSHLRARERGYGVFFVRRFFRIYPPYLAALLFFGLLFPVTWVSFHSAHGPHLWADHLLLVFNLRTPLHWFQFNPSFWSIAVEVQLYLLYPILLWMVNRFGWRNALIVTFVIEATLRAIASHDSLIDASKNLCCPFTYWFSWSIGAALADDMLNGRPLFLRKWPLWFWPVVLLSIYYFRPLNAFGFTAAALGTGVFISWCIERSKVEPPATFLLEQLRRVGLVSYAFYLLHQPFLMFVPWFFHNLPPGQKPSHLGSFILCLLELPFTLLLSWCFYRCIELPSIGWGKILLRRFKTKEVAS